MANIEASRQNVSPPIPAVAGNPIYPAVLVPELKEVIARPDRTSPLGLEQYIAGRTLVSGDTPAWSDSSCRSTPV